MFGSQNKFFCQDKDTLLILREEVSIFLRMKGRSEKSINRYLEAYDYFVKNPSHYDGATIVKDLVDIRNGEFYLDLDAMLHDYEYIKGANSNFIKKWKSDLRYIKNMEKNGKGIRIPRFIILTISGILYIPYTLLKLKYKRKK